MGKFSRDKGARAERSVVHQLQEAGLAAERIPLSGAMGGKFASDISVPVQGIDKTLEVKCRSNGFKTIYDWLEGAYGLVLKRDRSDPLVVLRLSDFAELARVVKPNEWAFRKPDVRENTP